MIHISAVLSLVCWALLIPFVCWFYSWAVYTKNQTNALVHNFIIKKKEKRLSSSLIYVVTREAIATSNIQCTLFLTLTANQSSLSHSTPISIPIIFSLKKKKTCIIHLDFTGLRQKGLCNEHDADSDNVHVWDCESKFHYKEQNQKRHKNKIIRGIPLSSSGNMRILISSSAAAILPVCPSPPPPWHWHCQSKACLFASFLLQPTCCEYNHRVPTRTSRQCTPHLLRLLLWLLLWCDGGCCS